MKITQATPGFQPVTIVLETQEELNYLYAISNTALGSVMKDAVNMGINLTEDRAQLSSIQIGFYNQLGKFFK